MFQAHGRLSVVALFFLSSGCMQAPDPADTIDGTWAPVRSAPEQARPALSYSVEGERLEMQSASGTSFEAVIDGDEAPVAAAPAGTTVSVTRLPSVSYREVVKRDGRIVAVRVISVADRRLATIVDNPLDGSATVYAAVKR